MHSTVKYLFTCPLGCSLAPCCWFPAPFKGLPADKYFVAASCLELLRFWNCEPRHIVFVEAVGRRLQDILPLQATTTLQNSCIPQIPPPHFLSLSLLCFRPAHWRSYRPQKKGGPELTMRSCVQKLEEGSLIHQLLFCTCQS